MIKRTPPSRQGSTEILCDWVQTVVFIWRFHLGQTLSRKGVPLYKLKAPTPTYPQTMKFHRSARGTGGLLYTTVYVVNNCVRCKVVNVNAYLTPKERHPDEST